MRKTEFIPSVWVGYVHGLLLRGKVPNVFSVGLLLCILIISCRDKEVAEKAKDYARELNEKTYPVVTSLPAMTKSSTRPRPRIYVDASISMAGYVTGRPTDRTQFDDFIDALGDALPGCDIYKFGQPWGQRGHDIANLLTPIGFDLRVHRPEFYNLEYNPDDDLINFLASEEWPTLSVLLTDGVHSDYKGQGNPPIVDAVHEWMKKGGVFGILILKSRFSGFLYSERLRAMLEKKVSVEARPFYAFIFSPSVQELNEVKEKLQKRINNIDLILFTDDAVDYELKYPYIDDDFDYSAPPKSPFYWKMFASDSTECEFSYNLKTTYSVRELSLSVEVSYYPWEEGQFVRIPGTLPLGFAYTINGNHQLQMRGIKEDHRDYGLYQVHISTSVKSLRDDILALSTRDDGDLTNARQTYKFYELIASLTDVHFESFLQSKSPTLFFTVMNR